MKAGDTVPVMVAGQVVAQATVKELDRENSTATLIVPGTLVVMATKTELTVEAPKEEKETQTLITGVDRPATQEAQEQPAETTAPVETPPVESAAVDVKETSAVEEKPVDEQNN